MGNENTTPSTTATTTSRTNRRPLRKADVRMIQNYLVVWLDGNINQNNNDYRNSITKLREVSNSVNIFTDMSECIRFISDTKNKKIFMIVSGAFGQTTVPMIHQLPQINTIYIFCGDTARHQQWTGQWSKIRGIFTDITPICQALKRAVQECDQNSISMSFVPVGGEGASQNLDQLDQSFMYTQILKEILLTIDFEQEHFMEFLSYCRVQFSGNPVELRNVDKLEKEYRRRTPIWWYTYQCFLYSTLNCALREMEVELIIKLGFFIRDLHQHITHLHSEQYLRNHRSNSFVVYRGQGLSQSDFIQLQKTKGGLLSFNNFLSTSKIRHVSLSFAQQTVNNSESIGVLFVMTINPSIQSTPFANVRNVGYYPDEEEILLSMHSIFRIGQTKQIDGHGRLWQVDLMLTGDQDPQLRDLTEHIRKETFPQKKGWYRLGSLLEKIGRFEQAEQMYDALLDQTTDATEQANIYRHLGWIHSNQGKYAAAITVHQQALAIIEKTLPVDYPSLANSYSLLGFVYDRMGGYSQALSFHQKALEIYEKTLPPTHPELTTSYCNIGAVYANIGEHSQALFFHQKAVAIREKSLPPNHPDLANSYSHIGKLYSNMGQYPQALSFYQKALAINQRTLPPNHPYLATSYSHIGTVYNKMGNSSQSLSFHERALDIGEHSLPPNHPHLQVYRNNVESLKQF